MHNTNKMSFEKERPIEPTDMCTQTDPLKEQQRALYEQIKVKEYTSCHHIWVTTLHEHDAWEGRSYNYCGCMKCGLDQSVFYLKEESHHLQFTLEQQIMYDFMRGHDYCNGIHMNVLCDLNLAKAIYSKIKEAHPNIDDETASAYFLTALDDIREIEVNNDRKVSRAKRLSLSPKFNRWNGRDVRSL